MGSRPSRSPTCSCAPGAVDVIVIDSVAALIPQAELDGAMGETQVGSQARLMSHAMRKLTGSIHKSKTCVIFINQIRMKIGMTGYGSPETTTGGNALKFYASIRLDIRKIQTLKDKEEVYGNRTRVKVVKNKVSPPFREAQFDILYGTGISREGEILDLGSEAGIVDKSGAWYAFGAERLGQGRENVRAFLQEHTDIRQQMEDALRSHLGMGGQWQNRRATRKTSCRSKSKGLAASGKRLAGTKKKALEPSRTTGQAGASD
jgi:recombination protein RecA